MATAQEVVDLEKIIEKIVFDEEELEELKIAVRNFSKGTITPKQLKQTLLNCRSRMVEEVTEFLNLCIDKARSSSQAPVTSSNQAGLENDQLRQEVAERNELLETVANKISVLVSKAKKEPISGGKRSSMDLEDSIKIEIKRVFSVIKAKEWLDMCGYDNYKFFVKLYPKLEELYIERFGESEETSNNNKDGKNIMANKMARLGFPEEVETLVINYVSIRNIFQHSMKDISRSNLEQAHEVFVKVLIYLIISSLDSKLVSNNRESIYSCLKDYFSKRLSSNPIFLKRMLERFKTVFYA